jgi:predicted amidohydrolase
MGKPRAAKPIALGLLPAASRNGGRPERATSKRAELALVQFAPRKGDVDANLELVRDAFQALRDDGRQRFPDVVVFPETSLSGYFVEGGVREVSLPASEALRRVSAAASAALGKNHAPFDAIVGFYEDDRGKLYNSALYARLGRSPAIVHVHRKMFLPTYGVFDEERFVSRGRTIEPFDTTYGKAAILICEDATHSLAMTVAAVRGAQVVFIPSASPGRGLEAAEPANVRFWRDIVRVAAAEHGVFIAYAGLLGFEGGKGFTGASKLVGPLGDLRAEAPFDSPAILRASIAMEDAAAARAALPMLGDLESNLAELVDTLDAELQRRPRRQPGERKRR